MREKSKCYALDNVEMFAWYKEITQEMRENRLKMKKRVKRALFDHRLLSCSFSFVPSTSYYLITRSKINLEI